MDNEGVDDKDVDEKLIKWNDIFEKLAIDTKALIEDLSEGIKYIAISAFILICIGFAALVIGLDRGMRAEETKYIAAGFIILCISSFNGAMTLRKWYKLRRKYSRLQSLLEETEHK